VQPAFKSSVLSAGDSISVELPSSFRSWLKPGTELSGFSHSNEAMLLLKGVSRASGYVAGSIGSLSIAEVLSHIVSGMKTGKLVVTAGAARKTVSFRDGQIIFAASTQPHERIGRLLVRLRIITADVLREALAQVKPGVKIGQVLISTGRVSPSNLYSAMTFLAREIAISLFELTEGGFLFLDGPVPSEEVLKLPERTRTILLEGMKRGEDVERLRRRIPATMRVRRGPRPPPPGGENLVLAAGAGRELAAMRSSFDGGEYSFLSAVDELLRCGALLQIAEEARPSGGPVTQPRSPIELYAALIKTICDALKSSGKDLKDLQSFFTDPPPGLEEPFAGVALSDEGKLDFDRVMSNTGGTTSALRRAQAYQALDGFVCYALFSAKNAMSAELAESLSNELRRIQSEVT
jgi:hypothetical protein